MVDAPSIPARWVARWALSGVALIAFIDTFAIVPLLAPYAIRELGATSVQAGIILALYSLASLLGNLGSGVLLDRVGRRVPMVISLCAAGLLVLLYAFARTPLELMVLRVLHGLAGAVYVPALFAMVAEHGGENRARAMGKTGALIGMMALVGPVTSGMVATYYGMAPVFWGVAALMMLSGLAVLSLNDRYERPLRGVRIHPRDVLLLPIPLAAFLLTLGMTFTMGVLTFSLPTMLEAAGFDAAYRGRMFGLFALVAAGFMAGIRGREALGGSVPRASLGVALLLAGAFGLNWFPIPGGTWISILLYGAGFGLTFPAVNLAAFDYTPKYLRGTALALLQAFFSLGYVLGPPTAGAVPALAGTLGAGVALVTLVVAVVLARCEGRGDRS